jgi:hypothetical protein
MVSKRKKVGLFIVISVAVLGVVLGVVFFRSGSEPKLPAVKEGAKLYLVVTRKCFVNKLADWQAERINDGFNVVVRGWRGVPTTADIKKWIQKQTAKRGKRCSYILIVGGCGDEAEGKARWHIPSVEYKVDYGRRSIESKSDCLYGDINGDGCPDAAVGRLAVSDAAQLGVQIAKILNHEKRKLRPSWFRTIIWAGGEGYAAQMRYVSSFLVKLLPKWMDRFFMSTDISSAYSGNLAEQPEVFIKQMSQPACFSIVGSHASLGGVAAGTYEGKEIILGIDDVARIGSQEPSGLLVLLGSDPCDFDAGKSAELSLAESFALHPGGPIGVFSSKQAVNPVTNYFISRAMIHHIGRLPERVGDLVLGIQRLFYLEGQKSLMQLAEGDEQAQVLLDAIPANKRYSLLPGLVRYEMLMYNLIGDPSCKFKLPGQMAMSVMASEKGELIVNGETETECCELFVEMIKAEREKDVVKAGRSEQERKECFEKANEPPETMLNQGLSDKKWRVNFVVPTKYFGNKDYLRFISIGGERSYVGLHGVHREKPFADRYREEETE